MKKPFLIFSLSYSLILLSSCTPQKTEKQETLPTEQAVEEVRSIPDYDYTDSIMLGSHKVVYTIACQPDDNLPVVVDEDGVKYKDNRYTLDTTKDGNTLFSRSFTKADFRSQLSEEFQEYGIMDGMRFNHAEDGKLYFNTCVSYPESDMTCPFFLTIGPDGSYTITPNTAIDEDDVPPPPAL